jgi:hypothetical protein
MSEKIITINQLPDKRVTHKVLQEVWNINQNPTFDRKSKPWTLVRIPKTTTRVIAWRVRINEQNFLATQGDVRGQRVIIHRSDEKGNVLSYLDVAADYVNYLDLESAVDRFYEENFSQTGKTEEDGE